MFTTQDGGNNTIGAIALQVEEGRMWLWQKAKEAFKYTYENHFEDADWFFKADDDTFVIMENLRYLLKNYSSRSLEPIGLGYKFHFAAKNQTYLGGGSGYVVSKGALIRFVQRGIYSQECYGPNGGFEDINVGDCLGHLGVDLIHAADDENRPYFIPFRPGAMFLYQYETPQVPLWFFNYSVIQPPMVRFIANSALSHNF